MSRRWRVFALVFAGAIAADQLTKFWARAVLPVDGAGRGIRVPVIDGYWDWLLAANDGAAFSMLEDLPGARVLLAVIAASALVAIGFIVRRARDDQWLLVVSLALMAGGAGGNLADRIATGRVTDFVFWHYGNHRWPIFNVADVLLIVAVGLFLIQGLTERRRPRPG